MNDRKNQSLTTGNIAITGALNTMLKTDQEFIDEKITVCTSMMNQSRYLICQHGLRFAGTLIKAGIAFAAAASDNHNNSNGFQDSSFAAISGWIPCLFVNHLDPICSGYIGYFKHRKKIEDIGAGGLARLTSQHSLGNMAMSAVGIKGIDTTEPLHLLPSANLTVNLYPCQDMISAHELHQWWRPDLNLSCSVY
ncbi:hypothetical protein GOBAR_AA17671 [Gossypium barbadense]|uniref:Uncharacterized protein n=1 Tax=Gossypium barbadense TaxID=3634 RepID=A0A2P5XI08_GOSBA|nr:hypothetical protein GOBAR_AA17671 [Gossypium barbadense]